MKKLLTALLAGLVLLPFMARVVFAAGEIEKKQAALEANIETYQPNIESFSTDMSENIQVDAILYTMGGHPEKGAGGEITYSQGMVGGMSSAIAWIFSNPAATSERYVADLLDSAGIKIAQPAYAQGLGFAALDPILNTWKTFRNLAYLLFVVIFLVIGFLIMLRQKVGGQTAVTAQQAIPSIIVALLLVTFSYAIAGLLIDLMYLVMYLLLALFSKDQQSFLNKNFLSLGWTMITGGVSSAWQAVDQFGNGMKTNLGQFGADAVKFLGSLTLAAVIAIAITLKIFELFFELLKTYVTVILSIAFAPIILAVGAIPGKDTFKQWMTDLIGNLAAFPVVLLVLIVFDELTGGIGGTAPDITTGGFQPPYLFGGGMGSLLPFIIGVGMIMIMPEIVKEAKKTLGVKDGIFTQFARDIGKSLEGGWKGGEIIPGVGFTNTSKWPMGGVSGENLARKQAVAGSTLIGGTVGTLPGAIRGLIHPGGFTRSVGQTAAGFGRKVADMTGDEQLYTAGREERKKGKKKGGIGYFDKPPKPSK